MLRSTAAASLARAALRQKPPLVAPALAFARTASRLARRRRPSPPPRPGPPPPHALAETTSVAGAPDVVNVPIDVPHDADGVLDRATGQWSERVRTLLSQPALVVARQLEPLNIFIGWEEANRYQLLAPDGTVLGFLLEEEASFTSSMSRQLLRTHRPFRAIVMSPEGDVLLRIHRPFSWVNSRIFVSTPSSSSSSARDAKTEMQRLEAPDSPPPTTALAVRSPDAIMEDAGEVIGETQQEWAFMRRRYNHFIKRGDSFEQFGRTDSGFLAWDFTVRDEAGAAVGSINRNFGGFGRELFTDTGQYVLRFEGVVDELTPQIAAPAAGALPSPAAASSGAAETALTPSPGSSPESSAPARELASTERPPSLPLDHRAVLLASAVSIDFDYFTRHRGGLLGGGGMFMPMPIPMGGGAGGAAGEAEAGSEAAEAGRVQGQGVGEGEGPMPSTETDEPGYGGPRGDEPGAPQGWSAGAGGAGDDVLQDPWANETGQDEGGTWSWGDLFDQDGGGDGGGGGDGDW